MVKVLAYLGLLVVCSLGVDIAAQAQSSPLMASPLHPPQLGKTLILRWQDPRLTALEDPHWDITPWQTLGRLERISLRAGDWRLSFLPYKSGAIQLPTLTLGGQSLAIPPLVIQPSTLSWQWHYSENSIMGQMQTLRLSLMSTSKPQGLAWEEVPLWPSHWQMESSELNGPWQETPQGWQKNLYWSFTQSEPGPWQLHLPILRVNMGQQSPLRFALGEIAGSFSPQPFYWPDEVFPRGLQLLTFWKQQPWQSGELLSLSWQIVAKNVASKNLQNWLDGRPGAVSAAQCQWQKFWEQQDFMVQGQCQQLFSPPAGWGLQQLHLGHYALVNQQQYLGKVEVSSPRFWLLPNQAWWILALIFALAWVALFWWLAQRLRQKWMALAALTFLMFCRNFVDLKRWQKQWSQRLLGHRNLTLLDLWQGIFAQQLDPDLALSVHQAWYDANPSTDQWTSIKPLLIRQGLASFAIKHWHPPVNWGKN